MNLPTRIFLWSLFVAACSLIAGSVCMIVPALADLHESPPVLHFRARVEVESIMYIPYPVAGNSYESRTDESATRLGAQSLPLGFNTQIQPIPTQWSFAHTIPLN